MDILLLLLPPQGRKGTGSHQCTQYHKAGVGVAGQVTGRTHQRAGSDHQHAVGHAVHADKSGALVAGDGVALQRGDVALPQVKGSFPAAGGGGQAFKDGNALLGKLGAQVFVLHLQKSLTGVSQKVLTSQLREMEENGLVERKAYPEVPPRVEYSLTPLGRSLQPIMDAMRVWGEQYKQQNA